MPQATGLVAELKAKFGEHHEFELERGGGGVFDVKVDDQLVFSKRDVGRFPHYAEVPNAITMAGIA